MNSLWNIDKQDVYVCRGICISCSLMSKQVNHMEFRLSSPLLEVFVHTLEIFYGNNSCMQCKSVPMIRGDGNEFE